MNRIRWAAWGVVDIEALDRQQRRNYIKAVRKELEAYSAVLHCGGSTKNPWYRISVGADANTAAYVSANAKGAFKNVCVWAVTIIGDDHERGADGGVRGAGAEEATIG